MGIATGPLMFTCLLVPKVTELCRKVLEDEGVAGDINVVPVSQVGLMESSSGGLIDVLSVQDGVYPH